MTTPIIVLFLLSCPLFFALLISKINGTYLNVRKYALWGLGICFMFFSIGHAVKADVMVQMLPPWVPFRLQMVYLTGVLELVIGVALFNPKYRKLAVQAAIVVLIIFFPANVHAAMNATGLGGHQWGPVYLLVRLPLQLVLIAWAYFMCLEDSNSLNRWSEQSIRADT